MGKKSEEKKQRVAEKGDFVADLSGHESKKRKRKPEKDRVVDAAVSADTASENVKGAADDDCSKREPRKKRKKVELESHEETNGRDGSEKKSMDSCNVRSRSEGIESKKKKKQRDRSRDRELVREEEMEKAMEKGKKKKKRSKEEIPDREDENKTEELKVKHDDSSGDRELVGEGEARAVMNKGKKKIKAESLLRDDENENSRDRELVREEEIEIATEKGKKKKKKKSKEESLDREGENKSKKSKVKYDDNSGDRELVGEEEALVVMNKGKKKIKAKSIHREDENAAGQQLDSMIGGDSTMETKKKKKKKKTKKNREGGEEEVREAEKKKQVTATEEKGKEKRVNESSRKVRFSDEVEVRLMDVSSKETEQETELVRGKRFTAEEDELVKKAVYNFIEDHGLGEEGLDMVLHCQKHPEIRNCWKEIGTSLPWRPHLSVYYRAHILFERSETSTWTQEERDLVLKYYNEHGSDWRPLADALGRHRVHVKDTWRRNRLINRKTGRWSNDEYQGLFDLVNMDLQMKVLEERKSKHGMLRDNIAWEAISERLSTRTDASCCHKWYDQLASPMVAQKIWADADDYKLLKALVSTDACSMEEVDWDSLVEGRSGELCRKRWTQMLNHINEYWLKSFSEQVEILSKRYCPDLVEVREAIDAKHLEDGS